MRDFLPPLAHVVGGHPEGDTEQVGTEGTLSVVLLPGLVQDKEDVVGHILQVVPVHAQSA